METTKEWKNVLSDTGVSMDRDHIRFTERRSLQKKEIIKWIVYYDIKWEHKYLSEQELSDYYTKYVSER